jgi:hypothetical protein
MHPNGWDEIGPDVLKAIREECDRIALQVDAIR